MGQISFMLMGRFLLTDKVYCISFRALKAQLGVAVQYSVAQVKCQV